MKLIQILERLTYDVIRGTDEVEIGKICYDSRKVEPGDVFVCLKGFSTDGHRFADRALDAGAAALVIQKEEEAAMEKRGLLGRAETVVSLSDTRAALASMAACYYGDPARELTTVGITGTKGKTTTACMIRAGLMNGGRRTGFIGTLGVHTGKRQVKSENTTPESLELQKFLREMVDAGCDSVVMEVSSQALKTHRVDGITFDIGIFTNFGEDHIGPGEHADREEYLQCKRSLFSRCRTAVGNVDDSHYEAITGGGRCERITYGMSGQADYRAGQPEKMTVHGALGMRYRLYTPKGILEPVKLSMPGTFNVMNALAATAALQRMGVTDDVIVRTMEHMIVPGRMEYVDSFPDCSVYIDYAHNEMSLESSLRMLRSYCDGRLVVLFGCGGNRPRERRFGMGRAAGTYADRVVITTDNPRFEDPEQILEDIECGVRQVGGAYEVIADRETAIRQTLLTHAPGDVILIAGKGHETYQDVRGVKIPMDDRKMVRKCTQTLL